MKTDGLFQRLRKRLGANGPGLTVAVVAMLVALTGGAFAASGALTSKQKKEVTKIAKKFAGVPGAPGATGPVGAKGDQGPAGKEGLAGKNGGSGTNGKNVIVTSIPSGEVVCNERGGALVEEEGAPPGAEVCNGTSGQDAGFNYLFSSNTAGTDPGSGKLALNNASANAASAIFISQTDGDANGLANIIAGWLTGATTVGTLLVRKAGAPGVFAQYTIKGGIVCTPEQQTNNPTQCAMTNEGSYDKINVTFVKGNGVFADGDQITAAYWASGSGILAPGAIETGAWAFTGTEADEEGIRVPISFAVPLKANLGEAEVHFASDADFTTFCKGNLGNPILEPGQLCVYVNGSDEFPAKGTALKGIFPVADPDGLGGLKGASKAGAVLSFEPPSGIAAGAGVYAVRGF
jgi:hypothetical protein